MSIRRNPSDESRQGRRDGEAPAGRAAQVMDRVCGCAIDRAAARCYAYRGATYYFCSPACQNTFMVAPDEYAK